jgi:hypothetical protein
MSNIRKWLKIMESVPAIFPQEAPRNIVFKKDATVMVDPRVGGGTGRYMQPTPNGAMVDIKGVARELAHGDFSAPERDYEDPYQKGNDWFHISQEPDTIGNQKDNSVFRAGDMVKIADVYGAVIGPGIGVFVAYGTTGRDAVISFDGKEIVVPVAQLAAALEQNSKDNFEQMDNDGVLSPMSLGSDNVKIEQPVTGSSVQEPQMSHDNEFSKWMSAVEEALKNEGKEEIVEHMPGNECDCGQWDCETCFPLPGAEGTEGEIMQFGANEPLGPFVSEHDVCPICGHGDECAGHDDEVEIPFNNIDKEFEYDMTDEDGSAGGMGAGGVAQVPVEEEDNEFIEKPKSGKGVKLGDIVQKTEFRGVGKESPLTHGEDNLVKEDDIEEAGWYDPEHDDLSTDPRITDKDPDVDHEDDVHPEEWDMAFGHEGESEDRDHLIHEIMYMQEAGLSKDNKNYSINELNAYSPEELEACYDRVMGTVSEAQPKATATKTHHHLDDLEDLLSPKQAHLPANVEPEIDHGDHEPAELPVSSRGDTHAKLANMNPSDQMRDWMSRINPEVGATEPELLDTPSTDLVVRTASDVPAVLNTILQAAGVQNPEWHKIQNLPGFGDRNIRGMGRQLFGMFTSTPLQDIKTIANVEGQGPNTDEELRAVAGFLQNHAEDMGEVEVGHGMAIPGYRPQVKEYRVNGIRFHVVQDPMGQYIYAYPDKDSKSLIGQEPAAPQLGGHGNMPRLREFAGLEYVMPTLMEQLKWDEELTEALLKESTLSKLIGGEKGGQKLVHWLHRKHQLSNEADLVEAPFDRRVLWKEFKSHPDNFVIVAGTNGVAGIKPYKKYIDDMTAAFAKKNKQYNPAGDSRVPYQIIAFTDDGQQVDPELLKPKVKDDEKDELPYSDPTVMKARMGLHHGRDTQNPDNAFNLLAEQIGKLITVVIAKGGVEREKMAKRRPEQGETAGEDESMQKIFNRIRPVMKTLANQALSQIHKTAQRYMNGGNFDAAQKIVKNGKMLKDFLITLDKSGDINLGAAGYEFKEIIKGALEAASGVKRPGDPNEYAYNRKPMPPEYKKWLDAAAKGNAMALKPILDAFREHLVSLA